MPVRSVTRHSLHGIEPMHSVPNVTSLIEQIDAAATLAAEFMRQHGIRLTSESLDVPLQDEVDFYLRQLVLSAYRSFQAVKEEASRESPVTADWEIEGYADEDRYFEVLLTGMAGAPRGFLRLHIYLRLT